MLPILQSHRPVFSFGIRPRIPTRPRTTTALPCGRHSFKVGAHLTDRRLYYLIASTDKGRFSFLETYTKPCPVGKQPVCDQARTAAGIPDGGLALADMVLGASNVVDLQLRGVVWHGQQKYFGGYFQDTWQVSQKLTLNMGLRYEYWRPWTLPRNAAANFDFSGDGKMVYSLQNPLDVYDAAKDYGRDAPLNPNVPRQGYTTSNVNLAPRLGFAYTMTPNTVIRVAGGIFYAGNINVNQMSDNQSGRSSLYVAGWRGHRPDRTASSDPCQEQLRPAGAYLDTGGLQQSVTDVARSGGRLLSFAGGLPVVFRSPATHQRKLGGQLRLHRIPHDS